jgi:DNA-binding MarR family transcriptional regulator
MTTGAALMRYTTLLFDLWLVNHLATGILDLALADSGLSADDFGLYSLLMGAGPATPTQLARWTGMRPTTLSAALKRMEQRGDITRLPNPGDRRSSLIALSDAGRAKHVAAQPAFHRAMRAISAALAPAEDDIRLDLQRLDAALRQLASLDARPYAVEIDGTSAGRPDAPQSLRYTGSPLTPEEEAEARRHLDWLRAQRTAMTRSRGGGRTRPPQ